MTQAEIRENIEKLKKAIASPATQDAFKPKLQEKLAEFQAKLEGAKEVEAQEKAISKLEDKTEKKIAKLNEVISSPKTSPKVKAAVSKGIANAKRQVKEAKQEGRREIAQKKKEVVQKAKVAKASKSSGAKRGRPKKATPAPAKKVVKRKTKAVVKYERALSSLDKLVNRTKELRERYKGKGVDLKRDSTRSAKAFGWRLKGSNRRPTKAQIQSGAAYWEARPNRADVNPKAEIKLAKGGWVKNSKGNYRKQTKAEIKNDVKFKAKKAGWKKSEATGDWYYEDRPNRTDKSRTLRYASGGFVKNSKGNYRKQTKAELAHDSRFKAKKAGWKQSEETGDWYYEDRPNRTDKSRKLKV